MLNDVSNLLKNAILHSNLAQGPDNGQAYWVHTSDNIRLRMCAWQTKNTCNGTVLLFPGRSEYIENYGRTVAAFYALDYGIVAIDWRGQGLSDRLSKNRMIGHVNRFVDYQKDVWAMVKAVEDLDLPKPWYLIGHSMGACIGLRAVMEELPVDACVFTSPMWKIKMTTLQYAAAWPLSWLVKTIGKGDVFVPSVKREPYTLTTEFSENKMTHDREMYQYWIDQCEALPDLTIGGPSMGWLHEALKECLHLSKLPSPEIPCAVFCADQDRDIDVRAVQPRMKNWPNGRYKIFSNSKHELFLEKPEIRTKLIKEISEVFS